MPTITKILLPVDFPNASLGVIHQSATLAHKFNAQILMLHVITGMSHAVASHTRAMNRLAGIYAT